MGNMLSGFFEECIEVLKINTLQENINKDKKIDGEGNINLSISDRFFDDAEYIH